MRENIVAVIIAFNLGITVAFGCIGFFYEYSLPYKRGQIDAVSGKVAFELKKKEDGSTEWTRIQK